MRQKIRTAAAKIKTPRENPGRKLRHAKHLTETYVTYNKRQQFNRIIRRANSRSSIQINNYLVTYTALENKALKLEKLKRICICP